MATFLEEREAVQRERDKREAAAKIAELAERKLAEQQRFGPATAREERKALVGAAVSEEGEKAVRGMEEAGLRRAAGQDAFAAARTMLDSVDKLNAQPAGTSGSLLDQAMTALGTGDLSAVETISRLTTQVEEVEKGGTLPAGSARRFVSFLREPIQNVLPQAARTAQGRQNLLRVVEAGNVPFAPPGSTFIAPTGAFDVPGTSRREVTTQFGTSRELVPPPGGALRFGEAELARVTPPTGAASGVAAPAPTPEQAAGMAGRDPLARVIRATIEAIGGPPEGGPSLVGRAAAGFSEAAVGLARGVPVVRDLIPGGTTAPEPPSMFPARGSLASALGELTDDELAVARAVGQTAPGAPFAKLQAVILAIRNRRQARQIAELPTTEVPAPRQLPGRARAILAPGGFAREAPPVPGRLPTRMRAILTSRAKRRLTE